MFKVLDGVSNRTGTRNTGFPRELFSLPFCGSVETPCRVSLDHSLLRLGDKLLQPTTLSVHCSLITQHKECASYKKQTCFICGHLKKSFEEPNLQDYGHFLTAVGFNESWAQSHSEGYTGTCANH